LAGWSSFAVIAGSAAGALIGLLFVAVSIRIEVIIASAELRNRAAQTLGLFVAVLLVAILLSVPDQAKRLLGVELLLVAVFVGSVLFVLDRRAQSAASSKSIAHVLDVVSPNTFTSLLLAATGLLLIFGVDNGLYVLVGAVIVAMVGGITSAWLFLTKITD
jgi:hypothetical protein